MFKKNVKVYGSFIIVIAIMLTLFTPLKAEASMDPYVGEITLISFGNSYAAPPQGYLFCEGQTLNISSNQVLFALITTTYGGNGTTTFNLPDLRGAEPIPGCRYIIAVQGIFPSSY